MKSDDIAKQPPSDCGAMFSYTLYSKSEASAWTMWNVTKIKKQIHTWHIY